MISHDMRLDHHPLSQVAQGLRVLQQISLLEKRSTAPPRVNTEGIGFFAASEFFLFSLGSMIDTLNMIELVVVGCYLGSCVCATNWGPPPCMSAADGLDSHALDKSQWLLKPARTWLVLCNLLWDSSTETRDEKEAQPQQEGKYGFIWKWDIPKNCHLNGKTNSYNPLEARDLLHFQTKPWYWSSKFWWNPRFMPNSFCLKSCEIMVNPRYSQVPNHQTQRACLKVGYTRSIHWIIIILTMSMG